MKFKKLVGLILSVAMIISSLNIGYAQSTVETEEEFVEEYSESISNDTEVTAYSTEYKNDTDISYAVKGGNIYFDENTGTITGADKGITSADIPNEINGVKVTNVGNKAFSNCYDLETVIMPNSVTSIGDKAFFRCHAITTITIPSSVVFIGSGAFEGCEYLISITLPSSITTISDYLFCNCKKLETITIPKLVTSIGEGAFSSCSSLTTITIPNSVTSIGKSAFSSCSGLTTITIPNSVTSIGESAFSSCSSLTTITIPNSVTSIGESAFYSCMGLTTITIPNSVTSIGGSAFSFCRRLKTITISNSVTSIAENTFYFCDSLTTITIPDSVVSIGRNAFYCCTGLTTIIIPNSITSIGGKAFYRCRSLTTITIPDPVTSIDWGTFYECKSLTTITIPNSVTFIASDAFDYCSELSDVYYGGTETEWNNIALKDNWYLTKATKHFNSVESTTEATTSTLRSIDADFFTDKDIIYNTANQSYNTDFIALSAIIKNTNMFSDLGKDLTVYPKNIKFVITLPSGYSFDKDTTVLTKEYAWDEISTTESICEKVYIQNPDVGTYEVKAKATGDNIKTSEFTYDITVSEVDFEVNKYRADYLLNNKIGSNMESTYINSKTPCQIIYDEGVSNGLDVGTAAWSALMDTLETVDDPSKITDMAFEEKDMYEAIIMDMFESSVDYKVMSCINNNVTKQTKSLVSTVTSEMKSISDMNILNKANKDLKSLTDKEKDELTEKLKETFKKEHSDANDIKKLTSFLGTAIDYASDFQSLCETISAYYEINQLNDSMKQVMQDMYNKCPASNVALKAALLDCIAVMNAGQEAFIAEMATYLVGVTGKNIAKSGLDKMWSSVKSRFFIAHPSAFAFQAAYKAGKYVTSVCFNSAKIEEKWCKVVAMVDIENIMKQVYYQEKSKYKSNKTETNAEIYNSAIDVVFNMLDTDYDCAKGFVNAVDSSLAGKLSSALGDSSVKDFNTSLQNIRNYTANFHDQVLTDWLYQLEAESTVLYNQYSYLLDEANERYKKRYNIDCPVDVYVYDTDDVLVGSVVGNNVYCRRNADISMTVNGDSKSITIYNDSEYKIVYVGNDSGTMDIKVTEYDGNENESREVYFNNIALSKGLTYTSEESGKTNENDAYVLSNESSSKISPDYDSLSDSEKTTYTATIKNGYFTKNMSVECVLHEGEKAEIVAYVPNNGTFNGWSSDSSNDIFDDTQAISTSICMPAQNININADVYSLVEETFHYGDADNDGLITASDAANTLQKTLDADFELPIETATTNWLQYIDADGDNILTAADAASILEKSLNSDFKFSVEKD